MKNAKALLLLAAAAVSSNYALAQTAPAEMHFSPDGHMLLTGNMVETGLYDESIVRTFEFNFTQSNYWNLLTQNYNSKTNLLGTLKVDGTTYDSVGIRFKGNTSYQMTGNSQKKSFNITTDFVKDGQDIMGYSTINLNNSFEDPSFMREFYYLHQLRKHIPAAKASYVRLLINGANWGVYPNVQQINKDFIKEWFMTNNGTNWRADAPSGTGGGGPGGGPQWGDGTAALNYLGTDTTSYKSYYTLKSTEKDNCWTDLVTVCDKLNNTAVSSLPSVIPQYLDVDRTLWFLASEIAFTDDDSYVYKGKMDYYAYWEKETGRIVPQEFDGNSSMDVGKATTWGPFYNANKANYPLLNKLLQVPIYRQRYLAHMRTIIADEFDTATVNADLNKYKALIDTMVSNDIKKQYTYAQFGTEVTELKTFINTRRNYLLSNTEVAEVAPVISNASHSFNNVLWEQPEANTNVPVTAHVTSTNGVNKVNLFYATGWVGNFSTTQMYDDGAHNDSLSGDGIYGADIPGQAPGEYVRYYIEAVANNTAKSVSYLPKGAEHDVFVYLTKPQHAADSSVVINEVMASNTATHADEAGEFDDWIELYNRSAQAVDISGFYLTDNPENIGKWEIPAGTILQPGSYLIVWADEDSSQGTYHANFKLSSSGEKIMLLNAQKQIVDEVTFGAQTTDQGYARIPNGTGSHVIKAPTFNANNEGTVNTGINELTNSAMSIYPNPADNSVYIILSNDTRDDIQVADASGRVLANIPYSETVSFSTADFAPGVYLVRSGNLVKRLLVRH